MPSNEIDAVDANAYNTSVMMGYIFRLLHIKTTSVRDEERSKLKDKQKSMEDALKALYDEKYEEIKKIIDIFGHILHKIQDSLDKTRALKEKLLSCKSVLKVNFAQYRVRWTKIYEISEALTLLENIEDIMSAPTRVDKLIKVREYIEACKILMTSYVRLIGDLSSFKFLKESEILLHQRREKLFSLIMDRIHILLFDQNSISHNFLNIPGYQPNAYASDVIAQDFYKEISDLVTCLSTLKMIPKCYTYLYKESIFLFKDALNNILQSQLDSFVEKGIISRHENACEMYLPDVFYSLMQDVCSSLVLIVVKYCIFCKALQNQIPNKNKFVKSDEAPSEVDPSQLVKLTGAYSMMMMKHLLRIYLKEISYSDDAQTQGSKTFCSKRVFENIFSQKNHTFQKHQATLFQFHPNSSSVTESTDAEDPFGPKDSNEKSDLSEKSFVNSSSLICCPDIRYYSEIHFTVTSFIEFDTLIHKHYYPDNSTEASTDLADYMEIYYTNYFYPYICQSFKSLLRSFTAPDSKIMLNISEAHQLDHQLPLIDAVIAVGKFTIAINNYIIQMPKYSIHLVKFYSRQLENVLSSLFKAVFQNTKLENTDENCASLSLAMNVSEVLKYTVATPFEIPETTCDTSNSSNCRFFELNENLMKKTQYGASHDSICINNINDMRCIVYVCESWTWFAGQLHQYIKFIKSHFLDISTKDQSFLKLLSQSSSDYDLKVPIFGVNVIPKKSLRSAFLYYTQHQPIIQETVEQLISSYQEVEMYASFFIRFLYLDIRIRIYSRLNKYFHEEHSTTTETQPSLHPTIKSLIRDLTGIHDMLTLSMSSTNIRYICSYLGQCISQAWIRGVQLLNHYETSQVDKIMFQITMMQRSLSGKLDTCSDDFSHSLNFYRLFTQPYEEIIEFVRSSSVYALSVEPYECLIDLISRESPSEIVTERKQKLRTVVMMKTSHPK